MFAVMKVLAGLGKDIGNVSTGAAPFLHTRFIYSMYCIGRKFGGLKLWHFCIEVARI